MTDRRGRSLCLSSCVFPVSIAHANPTLRPLQYAVFTTEPFHEFPGIFASVPVGPLFPFLLSTRDIDSGSAATIYDFLYAQGGFTSCLFISTEFNSPNYIRTYFKLLRVLIRVACRVCDSSVCFEPQLGVQVRYNDKSAGRGKNDIDVDNVGDEALKVCMARNSCIIFDELAYSTRSVDTLCHYDRTEMSAIVSSACAHVDRFAFTWYRRRYDQKLKGINRCVREICAIFSSGSGGACNTTGR